MPAPVSTQKQTVAPRPGGRGPAKPAPKTPPPLTVSPAQKPKAVISGIPVWSLFDEVLSVDDLKRRVHPQNDNNHDDTQTIFLANIIKQHGVRRSITLSRLTGRIVAGHGALKAAPLARMEAFPIQWQDFKSEAEELAHLMADNEIARLSQRDESVTAENLSILAANGYDLSLTGILEEDRTDLLALLEVNAADVARKKGKKGGPSEYDDIEEVSEELPGAKALKADMLFMPQNGYEVDIYDIPKLDLSMCMKCPEPFDSWAGPDGSPPQDGVHYLYNITSVMRELPIDRSLFGFYADDHRFEVVWNQPDKYAAKLLNAGFMGAVTPNFSLFYGAPKVTHINNIYKSRWIGRYFQEAGIKIIPDVPSSGLKSLEYIMAGIPKGVPSICIQCQTSQKSTEEIRIRRAVYEQIEQRLEPESIVVYGGDHTEEYLDGCFKYAKVIHILNRMQKRRSVISKNATAAALVK